MGDATNVLMALDLGFANTGYVLVSERGIEGYGVISTSKTTHKQGRIADDNVNRCAVIATEIRRIVEDYGVRGIVGELPSGGAQSSTAARAMALVAGCVGACVALLDLPCEWCTPTETKVALCGTKTASKKDMMEKAVTVVGGEMAVRANGTCYWMPLSSGVEGPTLYGSSFEHVADALGAFMALENGLLVKLMKVKPLSKGVDLCVSGNSKKRSKSSNK